MVYEVVRIGGLKASTRRGVAFLVDSGRTELDAAAHFALLDKEQQKIGRLVRTRMDYWIEGQTHDAYFHGWPNSKEYKDCFCFRWNCKGDCNRFYGFKCHPYVGNDAQFQVCILHSHAIKITWDTDQNLLDLAATLARDPQVAAAVRRLYPQVQVNMPVRRQ
jgi:hypothetical protein